MAEERWVTVPGFEGLYEVSDQGRVRSVDRIDARGHRQRGRLRRLTVLKNGYAALSLTKDGAGKTLYVHRLVAAAFLGMTPGQHVHHRNEVKTENRVENLEVVDNQEHHSVRHRSPRKRRLRVPGEPNPTIACACGCGERLSRYDRSLRPRSFISGHNTKLQPRRPDGTVRPGVLDGPDLDHVATRMDR